MVSASRKQNNTNRRGMPGYVCAVVILGVFTHRIRLLFFFTTLEPVFFSSCFPTTHEISHTVVPFPDFEMVLFPRRYIKVNFSPSFLASFPLIWGPPDQSFPLSNHSSGAILFFAALMPFESDPSPLIGGCRFPIDSLSSPSVSIT